MLVLTVLLAMPETLPLDKRRLRDACDGADPRRALGLLLALPSLGGLVGVSALVILGLSSLTLLQAFVISTFDWRQEQASYLLLAIAATSLLGLAPAPAIINRCGALAAMELALCLATGAPSKQRASAVCCMPSMCRLHGGTTVQCRGQLSVGGGS